MIHLLIVTHGEFGAYLVEAAEEIVGPQEEGVQVVSISARQSIEEVKARVAAAVQGLSGGDGLVVFTDMPGGTPTNAVLPAVSGLGGRVRVLSGFNLYMLVSAFNHRRGLTLEELAARLLEDGRKSIVDVGQAFQSRGQRRRAPSTP